MPEKESETLLEPVIRLGISACLLGQEVRYDGGHKQVYLYPYPKELMLRNHV